MTDRDGTGGGGNPRRLDRRVVLKASAGLAAMSLLGDVGRRATAQEGGVETLAAEWVEADTIGTARVAAVGEPQTFQTDFAFYAVAPHWSGEAEPGATVELSLSADGVTFTEPIVVAEAVEDAGRPERGGRRFGRLVASGGASFVQYRALDAAGAPTTLPGLTFAYLDATAGPTVGDVSAAALAPSIAPPPIISRAAWGANEAYRYDATGEIWPTEYQTVEHVIIHHTDTTNFQDPLVAMRSIYYYHAVTRGWGDIGYNYLVDFLGNVYEGRVGGDNVVGGHSYKYARGSSGIGTIGRFSFEAETPETQAGLVWITAWVGRALDPLAQKPFQDIPSLPTIGAHRDVNNTTCPGDFLYGDLPTIRNLVNAVLVGGADPAPDDPQFVPGDVVETTIAGGNLRQGPGSDFPIVVEMKLGELLTVTDGPTTNDELVWYALRGTTLSGWAATDILRRSTGAPPPPPPPPGDQFAVGDSVRVDTDALNLRSTAGLAGSVVAVLPTDALGTVQAGPQDVDGYAWYQIQTSFGTGWSAGSFLASAGTPLPPPPPPTGGLEVGSAATVSTDVLNLRAAAGLSQPVLATMPFGTPVTIAQAALQVDGLVWYGVSASGFGSGWSVADYLTAATGGGGGGIATGDTVLVVDGSLNLRAGPSLGAAIVQLLAEGTRLSVVGGPTDADGYAWYQLNAGAAGTGWSVGSFLRVV